MVAARPQVYLIIKDVCPGEDEVIIITSSLMKDMNSKTDLYRSNAIRVLCSICGHDTQLLVQIERYLKQAIVDKVVQRTNPPSSPQTLVIRMWSFQID